MTWFRVDDNLAFHPKAMTAGNAAMGLWVRAGAWAAHQLTDGRITHETVRLLGTPTQAKALTDAGLWISTGKGYEFHQWDERQPVREDIIAGREEMGTAGQRGNHLRWHAQRGVLKPDCPWCQGTAR